MSGARCDATIWPSWADRWIPCPGSVNSDGSCTAYGSQHQQQAPDPAPPTPLPRHHPERKRDDDAPESFEMLRERVARALFEADTDESWDPADGMCTGYWDLADAAIAVITTPAQS